MKKRIRSILLVIIGIFAIFLSIICFSKYDGNSVMQISYGGDAYTGIQNASAQTAVNIRYLSLITRFGFGSVLLISGLTIITVGITGNTDKKKHPLIAPTLQKAPIASATLTRSPNTPYAGTDETVLHGRPEVLSEEYIPEEELPDL